MLSAFIGTQLPPDVIEHLKGKTAQLKPEDTSIEAIRLKSFFASYQDYFLSNKLREAIRIDWLKAFESFDVILCPVMPTVAFPHDHREFDERTLKINGQAYPYLDQLIWCSMATLLGFPATVLPIGLSTTNLPIGVQVIGSYMEDLTTLGFAQHIENLCGGFTAPPNMMESK